MLGKEKEKIPSPLSNYKYSQKNKKVPNYEIKTGLP